MFILDSQVNIDYANLRRPQLVILEIGNRQLSAKCEMGKSVCLHYEVRV